MFGIPDRFVEQCLERFDNERQLDILIEECAELIKACSKIKRNKEASQVTDTSLMDNLQEELTHVAISSAVVSKIYNIQEDHVCDELNKKSKQLGFD